MAPVAQPGGADEPDQAGDSNKLRFLLRSAASLASTTLVTAALGFAFWAVAARAFPAETVGQASTAISAMGLLAPLSVLGFGTLVMVRLPAMREGRSTLVSTVTVVCGVVASLAALACGLLLPDSLLGLPGVGDRPVATLVFVGVVATQAVGNLLDQALLAAHGGGIQLGRNIIQAVIKLVLLGVFALALARFGSLNIVASWFLANAISIVAVVILLMRRYRVSLRRALPDFTVLRGMQFDAARHHGLNTSLLLPYFVIPIVANAVLGSEQAAYLYASWSLAGFVFFLPVALATALFASGARDSRSFIMEFRFTLRFALLICLAANLVIVVFGALILGIFGEAYARNGHVVLIVLALGSLGTVIKDHHVTLARVIGDEGREAALMAVLGAGEIAGAAIGASHGGLVGLSLGWLAAVGVEVVVCGPLVWRAYRGRVEVPARGQAVDNPGGAVQ